VAAARLGKTVTLLAVDHHLGGMTSSGLGVTDRGNTASIGGIAREFYRRVGQEYRTNTAVYFFEPHVAKAVFQQLLNEAGVILWTQQRLVSLAQSGLRITELAMEDGTLHRARMYIDATYEGDLMALAGVTFTVGREGTNVYGESLAGIRPLGGTYNYDPFVVPGDPTSGLLPFVQAGSVGSLGQGDHRVQAYNFRLCLTQNTTNKLAIAPPASYVEAEYELFARYLEARVARDGAVSLDQVIHLQKIIPNGKTDINANGELSTDYVGASYTWPTNTHAERALVRQAHEDYLRGYLHFLATSPRVPANVRAEMQTWGLAKDEFPETGGWPPQLYVREARRLVSAYVMTQANCESQRGADDPIALASYVVDCHGVQRVAAGGYTRWEGSLGGSVPYPYGVSYRAIVPRAGECENLFCTFALSASHVAFGSLRMEPVFMMTSQSAGTAAAFALDDQVPVQQVAYGKLAAQLRADGQLLAWKPASLSTNGIILDEDEPGAVVTGSWTYGANAGGWNGDYYHDGSAGKGAKWVRYTPDLPTNGTYEVSLWWVEASNRATNTPVDIVHAAGTNRVLINQQRSTGGWWPLLTTNFTAGTSASVTIRNEGTAPGTYVVADAVRFLPVGTNVPPPPPPVVEIVASDPVAGEFGTNLARFALVRSGATNAPLTVVYSVAGSATPALDYAALAVSVTLPAGGVSANLTILPTPDELVEGDETIMVTLQPGAGYTLSALSNATVTLRDRPRDDWRKAQFTAAELAEASVSGDLADPDADGLQNLMEYALGLSPKSQNGAGRPTVDIEGGYLIYRYTQSRSAADVAMAVEQSNDLEHWGSDPAAVEVAEITDAGPARQITVRLVLPVDRESASFLRLRVTAR
jgi:hypothetical protein